jgi:hypothetical protein
MKSVFVFVIALVLAACVASSLTGCASFGIGQKLAQMSLPEAQANLDLAEQASDTDGVLCFTAVRDDLAKKAAAKSGTSNGYPGLWESARIANAGIAIPPEVHRACAPLIVDAEKVLASFGLYAAPALGGIKVQQAGAALQGQAAALKAAEAAMAVGKP